MNLHFREKIKKALMSVGAFFSFKRKEQKIRKRRIIIPVLSVIFITPFIVFTLFSDNSPAEKIERARKLLAKAADAEATIYAKDDYKAAQNLWSQAMNEWKAGNDNSIFYKKFGKASILADKAIRKAEDALDKARSEKKNCENAYNQKIKEVRNYVAYIDEVLQNFPVSKVDRQYITKLTITMKEAESAYERGEIKKALSNISSIETPLRNKYQELKHWINNYFASFPKWKKLNEEMKLYSKQEQTVALVIDKFAKKCYVYKNGDIVKEFSVELGPNWVGDKQFSGDNATPEGKYHITKKKNGKKTKYYKSLEINYPNEEDKARFEKAQQLGLISRKAKIGGLIALHGDGGKGINWTEGCAALENKNIDYLFDLCDINTPVAIVGSLIPLDEIIKNQ